MTLVTQRSALLSGGLNNKYLATDYSGNVSLQRGETETLESKCDWQKRERRLSNDIYTRRTVTSCGMGTMWFGIVFVWGSKIIHHD